MKVALYARVSTAEQNPETQLVPLREYCARRNWQVQKEYVDQGVSGATDSRPALDSLFRDLPGSGLDALLVWKYDRLFRSVPHMLDALERLRYRGVDFISLTEGIDTTSPMGRMLYTILATIAEFERDLAKERTLAGMARARAEGKRIGRPRAVVDLTRMRMLRAQGMSYGQIARTMTLARTTVFEALVADSVAACSKSPP